MKENTLLAKLQDYINNLDKKIQLQYVPSENIYQEIARNSQIATAISIRDDLKLIIKDAKHD